MNILKEKEKADVQKDIVDKVGVPRDVVIQFLKSESKQKEHCIQYIEVKDIALTNKYVLGMIVDIEDKV